MGLGVTGMPPAVGVVVVAAVALMGGRLRRRSSSSSSSSSAFFFFGHSSVSRTCDGVRTSRRRRRRNEPVPVANCSSATADLFPAAAAFDIRPCTIVLVRSSSGRRSSDAIRKGRQQRSGSRSKPTIILGILLHGGGAVVRDRPTRVDADILRRRRRRIAAASSSAAAASLLLPSSALPPPSSPFLAAAAAANFCCCGGITTAIDIILRQQQQQQHQYDSNHRPR
mmetsp:Transcript_40656/g.122405  ORF Transcript_40656/g.122405 Transcript_40656/m.122405 type:complete len:225 (+) Transcript_40656:366-1040(+)